MLHHSQLSHDFICKQLISHTNRITHQYIISYFPLFFSIHTWEDSSLTRTSVKSTDPSLPVQQHISMITCWYVPTHCTFTCWVKLLCKYNTIVEYNYILVIISTRWDCLQNDIAHRSRYLLTSRDQHTQYDGSKTGIRPMWPMSSVAAFNLSSLLYQSISSF